MTWVKVCGITSEQDAATAVEAGADALGFVLADFSPRYVDVERAASLMDGLPVLRILVTAHAAPSELVEAAMETGADGVQPHGRHKQNAAAAGAAAGLLVLHPLRMGSGDESPDSVPGGQIPLLDTAHPELLGGTGVTFDWSLIDSSDRRFVLSGGLGPHNVMEAVRSVSPWGVDASSGLESAPGVKDPGKVADFVARAKGT